MLEVIDIYNYVLKCLLNDLQNIVNYGNKQNEYIINFFQEYLENVRRL